MLKEDFSKNESLAEVHFLVSFDRTCHFAAENLQNFHIPLTHTLISAGYQCMS